MVQAITPPAASAKRLENEYYTVGWICAITTENVAAQTFLDEEHGRPLQVSTNDNNDYTLGEIGGHYVVIAALPRGEYGISSATGVARDMLHSFPNIRIGLMVGIAGGAPSKKHDIRLGDIVVSSGKGEGGVFQYDFGRAVQHKAFAPSGFLNQPPTVLRTAVGGLETTYERHGHHIIADIEAALAKNPRLRKKYKRPDLISDRLYRSDVIHPDDETDCAIACGGELSKLITRPERDDDEDNPVIHYGIVASANALMKDALIRDALIKTKDVLCFEMEAAGLMNNFPCLVIRGICDYSDTHKNKEWQGWAAMTAAAYAHDLLHRIPANKVEAERKISDILSSVKLDIKEMSNTVQNLASENARHKIQRWLLPPDPSINYNKASAQRQEGTGHWLLNHQSFQNWKTRQNSFMWLHGNLGCGKTILSFTIIEHLEKTQSCQSCLYFFFDFSDSGKQTLENMLRSLISQLYQKCSNTKETLDSLISSCEEGHHGLSCTALCEVFLQMLKKTKEVWMVLDALDECHTRKGDAQQGLLSWIQNLLQAEDINVHILVTSRLEHDIKIGFRKMAQSDEILPIQTTLICDDIRNYIHARVTDGDALQRWCNYPDVQHEIETALVEKADGMFRWVACQIDAIENCLDYPTLRKMLASLPKTLDETYHRILQAISVEHKQQAIRILQFLTFSKRPLRIEEVVDALAVDTVGGPYFNPRNRMPDVQEITLYCSSLVAMIAATEGAGSPQLQLAHFSVQEFLTTNCLDQSFAQELQESAARASIAKVCLAYMLHLDEDASPQDISGTLPLAQRSVRDINKLFPLAQYSAESWMAHALVAEGRDKSLQSFIEHFFCYGKRSYEVCFKICDPDRLWDDVSDDDPYEPAPALAFAAFGGLSGAVNCLLDRGANINAQSTYFGTPLQSASYNGHEHVVKLLLNRGADVNTGELEAAAAGGYERIVKMLLERGADPDTRYKGGSYGAALLAASNHGHDRIVELLLDKGANVNAQKREASPTALYAASLKGHERVVELLLKNGADAHMQNDRTGRGTALYIASRQGHERVVQMLLDKSNTGRRERTYYRTALEAASVKGHKRIVQMISNRANASA